MVALPVSIRVTAGSSGTSATGSTAANCPQAGVTVRCTGRYSSLEKTTVSAPPPLTARSKAPSTRVRVQPSPATPRIETSTPGSGAPSRVVTLPRRTAARCGSIAPEATSRWIGFGPV
jgi:hypothetical protein